MAESAVPWLRRTQKSVNPAGRHPKPWWLLSLPLLLFLVLPYLYPGHLY
jgi:hypothetical protein